MNKLLLFVSVLALTFTSCSSDDDSNNSQLTINSQNILGKWYIKGGTINEGSFVNYNHDCNTDKDFQEFFENGELTFNGYNTECELNEVEMSLWVLNGNILTVSNTNFDPIIYEYTYEIESLTSSELILQQTVTEEEGMVTYRTTFTRN